MNNEQEEYQPPSQPKGNDDSGALGKIAISLLGIFFFPAVVLGFSMQHLLLKKWRQKLSINLVITFLIIVFAALLWVVTGAGERVIEVVMNFRRIDLYWTNLIPAYSVINLILGSIGGCLAIAWSIRKLNEKSNKHLRELESSWMYQFKFRRTPYEYYRRKKIVEGLKNGKYHSPDKIALGITEDDDIIYRYNTEMPQSTLISGTVGSGKTITELGSIHSDIINGISIAVIDFKNSAEFSSKIAKWSADHGRNFYHFVKGSADSYSVPHSPGQAYYDPLKNGGASKSDMILGMREYDTAAEVYKSAMRELLQTLFRIMGKVDRSKTKNVRWNEGEIYKLHSIVNGLGGAHGNLTDLVDATDGTEVEAIARDLEIHTKTRTHALSNAFIQLQGQIKTLVNSEYGRWLKTSKNGRNIDLFKLLKDPGNVVLFSMDGEVEKDFAKYMGSLIVSDLSAVSAKRRHHGIKSHVNIYIDEFQAISPTSLAPLLEKSRQSGFGITMASQSFEQIIAAADANGEAHLRSILDTCANFIIHAGSTESSAERLAGLIGKSEQTVYRQGHKNENSFFSLNWKNRQKQTVQTSSEFKWIVPPSYFMNLSIPKASNGYKSTAVIVKKSSDDLSLKKKGVEGTVVEKVWMIPDNRVLEEYFTPVEEYEDLDGDEHSLEDEETTPEEVAFDEPPVPLDYIQQHSFGTENESDELDAFSTADIDDGNDEESDGGFGFETIDEDEEEDALNNIDPALFVKNRPAPSARPKVSDSLPDLEGEEDLPEDLSDSSVPSTPTTRAGLPQRPLRKPAERREGSFNMFAQQEDFQPVKRRRERPKVVEENVDFDGDELPDLEDL